MCRGPSALLLAVLLNSRLLDFYWRFLTVPLRGNYFSANRQFIAPLPICLGDTATTKALEPIGARLHETNLAIESERSGFLRWLGEVLGVRVRELSGWTRLMAPESVSTDEIRSVLRRNRPRLREDPDRRAFHELLTREHGCAATRIGELRRCLAGDERAADAAVYELYRLSTAQREMIDGGSDC